MLNISNIHVNLNVLNRRIKAVKLSINSGLIFHSRLDTLGVSKQRSTLPGSVSGTWFFSGINFNLVENFLYIPLSPLYQSLAPGFLLNHYINYLPESNFNSLLNFYSNSGFSYSEGVGQGIVGIGYGSNFWSDRSDAFTSSWLLNMSQSRANFLRLLGSSNSLQSWSQIKVRKSYPNFLGNLSNNFKSYIFCNDYFLKNFNDGDYISFFSYIGVNNILCDKGLGRSRFISI